MRHFLLAVAFIFALSQASSAQVPSPNTSGGFLKINGSSNLTSQVVGLEVHNEKGHSRREARRVYFNPKQLGSESSPSTLPSALTRRA
jgi:hypothetical protein